jgi:hypothetical protein
VDLLEAINSITASVGTPPVNSLSTGHPDVARAKNTLDTIRKEFQTQGYWYNNVKDVEYLKDVDGFIYVPINVMDVEMTDGTILKGNQLYNITDKTYTFTANVTLDAVLDVAFEELPNVVAYAIAAEAKATFFTDLDGDQTKLTKYERTARRLLIKLKQVNLQHLAPSANTQTMASKLLSGNPQS